MSGPTIWQRAWLVVVNTDGAPVEYLEPLLGLGFRCLAFQVHNGLEPRRVDPAWWRRVTGAGFELAGWGQLTADDPKAQADVAAAALRDYSLGRYIACAEDAFKWTGPSGKPDVASGVRFARSREFLSGIRWSYGFGGELALYTYPGVDLDHKAWQAAGARLWIECYAPGEPRGWPVPMATTWAVNACGWNRARVKPILGCFAGAHGQADPHALIAETQQAATLGFGCYYAEGGNLEPGSPSSYWQPFGNVIGTEPGAIAR